MLSLVWIAHEAKAYELAKVLSENIETAEITVETTDDGKVATVKRSATQDVDPTHFGDFDDLCEMNNM